MCMMLFAASATVSASLQEGDFSLGGINLKMTYDDVINMYGQPTRQEEGYSQLLSKEIFYGDSVEIGFLGNKIRYVTVMKNNGWTMPNGIKVGMPLNEAIAIGGDKYNSISSADWGKRFENSPYHDLRWQGMSYIYSFEPDSLYTDDMAVISWTLELYESDNDNKVDAVTIREIIPEC